MADNANPNPADTADDILDPEDKLEPEPEPKEELTDEELQQMILEDEARALEEAGLGKFKSVTDLIQGYRDLNDEDKVVFPKVKALAASFNMTPHQFIETIDAKIKAAGGKTADTNKPSAEDSGKKMETFAEQTKLANELQNRFLRFQLKMDKVDTEIPDGMYNELSQLLPSLFVGKTREQIAKMDWFGEAYDLHLFRMSKTKDPEDLRKKLSAHDAKRLLKLKQLGVPRGGPGKGKTTEDSKTWGSGIDALPEPKK